MKKAWRTVQPPHESPNVTYEQALEAWLKVKAQEEARRRKRRTRANASTHAPREV